jgi:hypothetical protein
VLWWCWQFSTKQASMEESVGLVWFIRCINFLFFIVYFIHKHKKIEAFHWN